MFMEKSVDSGSGFLCRICMLICKKHKILYSYLCLVLLCLIHDFSWFMLIIIEAMILLVLGHMFS